MSLNPLHFVYLFIISRVALIRWRPCETHRGLRRLQRIWTAALSRATKAPALKGNGPTHRLTDLKGWLTNTPGRKATGGEGACARSWMPSDTFSFCFSLFRLPLWVTAHERARSLVSPPYAQHKRRRNKQIGFSSARSHCFTPGSQGNLDHFARKHAHVEMLTGWAAPINLNKIQWCSPIHFLCLNVLPPRLSVHKSS